MKCFHCVSAILVFLFIVCLLDKDLSAQNITWRADLPAISGNGFYKIPLSPQLLSKADNKLNRIRIFEGDTEVPFLIKKEMLATSKALSTLCLFWKEPKEIH